MDEITRIELEKIHGRFNDLKERVVTLEAQQPHINAALVRLEALVTQGFSRIGKIALTVIFLFLTPFVAVLVKSILSGALSHYV